MTKELIISEIRRTTKANGGVCLGVARFLQETGIREADWKGKYWARWSDAAREAGVESSQLTVALDENVLLEKFIAVMREFGRVPVVAEMRMKRQSDPSLPNEKTYSTRYGSKQQLATKLQNYSEGRPGYEDVFEMCTTYLSQQEGKGSNEEKTATEKEDGYVYLMKSGRFYKIGRSNSAGRREYELAIQLPEKLKTVHTIKTDDPAGIEDYWHRRFEPKHKNGEWYDLDSSDVRAFRHRKFM